MESYTNPQGNISGNQVKASILKPGSFPTHPFIFHLSPSYAAYQILVLTWYFIIIIMVLFIFEAKIIKTNSTFQTSENKPQAALV